MANIANILDVIIQNAIKTKGMKAIAKQLARMERTTRLDNEKYHKLWNNALTLANDYNYYKKHGDDGLARMEAIGEFAGNLRDKRYAQNNDLRTSIRGIYDYDMDVWRKFDDLCRKKWKKGRNACIDLWYGGGFTREIPTEQEVLLDPLMYVDSPFPMVRDYARKIVNGEGE